MGEAVAMVAISGKSADFHPGTLRSNSSFAMHMICQTTVSSQPMPAQVFSIYDIRCCGMFLARGCFASFYVARDLLDTRIHEHGHSKIDQSLFF